MKCKPGLCGVKKEIPEQRKEQNMKPFTTIAIIVFSLIALIHLLRLFFLWEVTINGMILPIWISVPGVLIASVLAFMVRQESRK
jgi:hypothetical protein